MNLYEINREIERLGAMVDEQEVINAETGEVMTLAQAIEELEMDKATKIENVALWIKNLAAEADAIACEVERLEKRRKAAENKAERLKGYLLSALMHEDGTADKFRSARATVTVRQNQPKIVVDEALLPDEFKLRKITVTPDRAQLKEVLLRGIEVPGAALERGRSVVIK